MTTDILSAMAYEGEIARLNATTEALKSEIDLANRRRQVAHHEIKTPLNAILGYSDLLCDDQNTATDITEFTQRIHSSAQSLARIVDTELSQKIPNPQKVI